MPSCVVLTLALENSIRSVARFVKLSFSEITGPPRATGAATFKSENSPGTTSDSYWSFFIRTVGGYLNHNPLLFRGT